MSATYGQKLHATSADGKNKSPFCAGPAGGAPSAPRQPRWSGPLHGTAPSGQFSLVAMLRLAHALCVTDVTPGLLRNHCGSATKGIRLLTVDQPTSSRDKPRS
jgi:hypothetical protein